MRLPRLLSAALFVALLAGPGWAQQQITVDAQAPPFPFPHVWETAFGSGRAILALRESYLNDLVAVQQATGFRYLRFHAILHDELGVYNEDEHGNPVYNFTYVNEIYEGLLRRACGRWSKSASCRRS